MTNLGGDGVVSDLCSLMLGDQLFYRTRNDTGAILPSLGGRKFDLTTESPISVRGPKVLALLPGKYR